MFFFSTKKSGAIDATNPDELLRSYYSRSNQPWHKKYLQRLKPDNEQKKILVVLAVQMVLIVVLYQWSLTKWVLYPFELISTVFHEFGHAAVVSFQFPAFFNRLDGLVHVDRRNGGSH